MNHFQTPRILSAGRWASLALATVLSCGHLAAQDAPPTHPEGSTGLSKAQITTGGSVDPYSGNGTRSITDLHVPGALSSYGLDLVRSWQSLQPADEIYSPFWGGGWTHNWHVNAELDYELIDPGDGMYTYMRMTIRIMMPDGSSREYTQDRNAHEWPNPHELPPYTQSWQGKSGYTDHIGDIDPWGRWFWLKRSDGGTILFSNGDPNGPAVEGVAGYQAVEIRDPHGVPTYFRYNFNGTTRVVDAGGKALYFKPESNGEFSIGWLKNWTDDPATQSVQKVTYTSGTAVEGHSAVALLSALTQGDPRPATYTYEWFQSTGPEQLSGALLRVADDPRYAGPMQKIRYVYRGEVSPNCPPGNPPYPGTSFDKSLNTKVSQYAIAAEQHPDTTTVMGLSIPCNGTYSTGTRGSGNGIGGGRTFFYGWRSGFPGVKGYILRKVTDYFGQESISERPVFTPGGTDVEVYDFRGTKSLLSFESLAGKLIKIQHAGSDNSIQTFDYANPGSSAALNGDLIRNNKQSWLFSKTDERNFTTTYVRDSQRRVQTIQHPSGHTETMVYRTLPVPLTMVKTTMTPTSPYTSVYKDEASNNNGREGYNGSISIGQTTSYTLASGAVQYRTYDSRHRLTSVYDSVDGVANAVTYTYYEGTGTVGDPGDPKAWADQLKSIQTPRARSFGAGNIQSAEFEYNSRFQITKVKYPENGGVTTVSVIYEYDDYGRCKKITNELGHWKKFDFDDYGRCIEMEEQLDAPNHDGSGSVASRKWNWTYGRWNGYVVWDGKTHTDGQWHSQIEPAFNAAGDRRKTYRDYDVNQRHIRTWTGIIVSGSNGAEIWTAEAAQTQFQYDVQGNKTAVIDPLGRTTTTAYDLRNRPASVTDPLNQTTTTAYNFTSQKTLLTFPDGKTQQFLDIDAYGQPWRTIDERGNTTNLEYQWGPMKKLFKVTTHRDKDAGGMEDQVTAFYYHGTGRETRRNFPDGTFEEFTFEKGGEVLGRRTRRGRWQLFTRDVRSREIGATWDNLADAGLQPVSRVWDAANRLTSIANNVATIAYTYDKAGQVLTENNYIAGGTGSPGNGLTTTYRRYPDGTVSRLGYPNGVWIQRNYNGRGELTGLVQVDPGNPSWSWAAAEFYYYLDGKPSWTNRGNGTSSRYFYDGKGNLSVSEDLVWTSNQDFVNTTVLTLGQSLVSGRYTLALQSGGNLVLTENGVQRWASNTNNGHQLIMQGDGNLVLYTSGGGAAWATWTHGNANARFSFQNDGNLVVYSAAGAVKWVSNTSGQMAQSLNARWYARDNRDRLTAITKGTVSGNAVENGRSDRFFYDFEGQLTDAYYDAVNAAGTPSGMAREDHFVYDQLGNRKSNDWLASLPGWWNWTRRDNGLNQVKNWYAGLPANWDDQWGLGNGNLIQDGNFTAWYNALNQPMWFVSNAHASGYATHLAYDPLGRCVKRWTALNNSEGAAVGNNPATYYYYEGWNLIQEGTGAGSWATQIYVHGARVDEIVARYHYGVSKWYFHHYDGRTHCQMVTTNNAVVAEQYAYDAFGWPYMYNGSGTALALVNGRPVSAIGNRFLFTGREWLTDWGIYDYRHRQYHPLMGRFLQPDPKHFEAGDYNLYRYCHNDPVNKTDPTGLEEGFEIQATKGVGGTAGFFTFGHLEANVGLAFNVFDPLSSRLFVNFGAAVLSGPGAGYQYSTQTGYGFSKTPLEAGVNPVSVAYYGEFAAGVRNVASGSMTVDPAAVIPPGQAGAKRGPADFSVVKGGAGGGIAAYAAVGALGQRSVATPSPRESWRWLRRIFGYDKEKK